MLEDRAYRVWVTDALYALLAFTGNRPRRRYGERFAARAGDMDGLAAALGRLRRMGIGVVN